MLDGVRLAILQFRRLLSIFYTLHVAVRGRPLTRDKRESLLVFGWFRFKWIRTLFSLEHSYLHPFKKAITATPI
jgi:hypothetical protein